jgi:UDP-3-O-[3-hydroxymyristoyl] glucosamine N-acyltransferase
LKKRKTYTLGEITNRFGGELIGNPAIRIRQIAALEAAAAGDITFVAQARYLPQLEKTGASAVILALGARDATAMPRIVCANPYAYYAAVANLLNPPASVIPGVHKSAVVDKTAHVAESAQIDACAVIARGAHIGAGVVIGPGCFVGENSRIGAATRLYAKVTVYHGCHIGERCIIHAGAVIGSDGFGNAKDGEIWRKIPQIGGVAIGDDVEIGANTTIDRGALADTVIGNGVKLDNQIQIAHNVIIGEHTAIAACVGIAGSARIGRNCALGGASMIYGHITIADNVSVSAGTLIMKSLEEPGTYTGVFPFTSHQRWLKNATHLRQLDELVKRVRELESRLGKTEKKPT